MEAARRRRRRSLVRRAFFTKLVRWSAAVVVALLIALFVVPLGCGQNVQPAPPSLEGPPLLRVRIVSDSGGVKLKSQGLAQPASVRTGDGQSRLLSFPVNTSVPVALESDGWHIGSTVLPAGEMTIQPLPAGTLAVEGRAYRGSYRLTPTSGGKFDVINDVPVDDYLKGVLAAELFPEFHPEAYKAQAVAARTYAIYVARTTPRTRRYDLHSDVRSQMYGGITTETSKSIAAATETAGLVLADGPPGQQRIFKAYYSSCCGGATQTPRQAFGEADSSVFQARSVGRRCDISTDKHRSRFDWGPIVVSKQELARRFQAFGRNQSEALRGLAAVHGIRSLTVFGANEAERPTHFTLEDERGAKFLLTSEQLRLAVNTDAPAASRLPSGFVTPVVEGPNVRFKDGHGFGHGVGLCQWCIEAEARAGASYPAILADAYPHAVLLKGY